MLTLASTARLERLPQCRLSATATALALQAIVSPAVVVTADQPDLALDGGMLIAAVNERRVLRFGRTDGPPLN